MKTKNKCKIQEQDSIVLSLKRYFINPGELFILYRYVFQIFLYFFHISILAVILDFGLLSLSFGTDSYLNYKTVSKLVYS